MQLHALVVHALVVDALRVVGYIILLSTYACNQRASRMVERYYPNTFPCLIGHEMSPVRVPL